MRVAEPVVEPWIAELRLGFELREGRTAIAAKRFEGPLALQKPFYPEGPDTCHAVVVHPPGGIAGGDELRIGLDVGAGARVVVTTPGAGKWYRTTGAWARQRLAFRVEGILEWLPRETIVFDGARAALECAVELGANAGFIDWEVVCLGRTGSGERFARGALRLETSLRRDGRRLWLERGRIDGDGALLRSPAGLAGHSVVGTLACTLSGEQKELLAECRRHAATTRLPGLLVARYLGDSTEEAMNVFTRIWQLVRPVVTGRAAVPPRIWST